MSNEFSVTTERIFAEFSGLVELCKGLTNFAFIWQSLMGSCYGNQLTMQNRSFWQTNLHCRAGILKWFRISEH